MNSENIDRIIKNSLEIEDNITVLQKKKKVIDNMIYRYMQIKEKPILKCKEAIVEIDGETVKITWKEGFGNVDDRFK